MDQPTPPADFARRIDLTKATEAQYWCRVFDVTLEQLREAVHKSGHQAEEVERYLRGKRQPPGPQEQ